MRSFFRLVVQLPMLFVLAVGCQKGASPPSAPDSSPALGAAPANEDPEVADYCKKKGWWLMRDLRIADGKPVVALSVSNRDRPAEEVAVTADDYKMIARSKTVQLLDLKRAKNTDEGLKVVAGIPQLIGILVGGDDVTDAGVKALAQCKSLDSVTLSTKKVTDAGIKELAALPKLQWLYLWGMTLSGSGFEPFAGSKTLESITLEYVEGLTDDGARNLAKLPNLNELKLGKGFDEPKLTAKGIKAIVDARLPAKFEFNRNLMDDDLLESLVKKGWLYGPTPPGAKEKRPATAEQVQYLFLDSSKITDRGLQSILNCTNVTSLHVDRTGVTDETLKKLSAFKKLDHLSLEATKVTAVGLDAITALPIKHIGMQGCDLSEDAFKAFAKMPGLEELWLSRAKMKAEWLKHIATLPKLRDLSLLDADFDDAAVKYVTTMPSLQSLSLNNTRLGDAGFKQLVQLPRLQSLYVDSTQVSRDVYQKAKKDHPKLSLFFYRYDQ